MEREEKVRLTRHYEDCMERYYRTADYRTSDGKINRTIAQLKATLSPEQAQLLNNILDEINDQAEQTAERAFMAGAEI